MEKLKTFIKEAKTRILTAGVLLLALALIALADSYLLVWAVLGAIYMISFYEACNLFEIKQNFLYPVAGLIWLICPFVFSPVLVVLSALVILVSLMLYKGDVDLRILSPFIYPALPMVLLLNLYAEFELRSILWLIVIVSFTDVGAYVVGKFIGKTKFSSISPNKTIEGVMGGVGIATLVGVVVGLFIYSFWFSLIISFAVSLSSVWGDLFESYLKRKVGVKDSGTIFPGHGGMLDRMDGYLFGVIIMLALLEGLA